MRVHAPTVARRGDRVAVVARFEPASGDPVDVELEVPRELLGDIDPGATAFLPMAAIAAAAAGEDLEVEGSVSPAVLAGARTNLATMAGWWGWRLPTITATEAVPAAPGPGRGVGLFFSRGVDSWASLLSLQAEGTPPTHLLTIRDIELPRSAEVRAEVVAETGRSAAAAGVPLLVLSTNARDLLDRLEDWPRTHAGVLAGFALLLRPMLERAYIAGSHGPVSRVEWGSHPDLDPNWSSETSTVVYHQPEVDRTEKIAIVAGSQLALDSLLVCWEGGGARNCGVCPKCLRTMTALELVGGLDRSAAFDRPLTATAVREAAHPDTACFVRELLDHLPPGDLRAAWERHLPPDGEVRHLVAPTTAPMTGLSLPARVTDALSAVTGRAGPTDEGPEIRIGWEPGMVPLRPRRGTHRRIRTRIAAHDGRSVPWVVADLSDQFARNDPWPAAVAERADRAWGPGLTYLAGIGWGDPTNPVLDHESVGHLLDLARIRVWWSPEGTLDPLRVVESIEHGCLPLQVMPTLMADTLRPRLPRALAPLVTDLDGLAGIDPTTTAGPLQDAAAVVLAGSAERDLLLAVENGLVLRG